MYLPADELARFGCSMSDIVVAANERSRPSKRLEGLLRFQVTRARTYYESGLGGIWFLPPRLRPAILIAGRLYRAILDEIENSGYDVLRRRAYTYPLTKVREAAMAFFNLTLWSGIEGLGQRNRLSPVGVGTTSPNEALTEVLSWLE
jgi:phytoene/squalene synthetase